VGVSTFKIERLIAWRASAKSMADFIAYHVGFRLDDTSAYSALRKVMHDE